MLWRGRPVTKGRPRLGRRRKAYTPARTVEFENSIHAEWIKQHPGETFPKGVPVGMTVIIGSDFVEVDVYELETGVRPKYVTGDIDNYVKAISDGLNGAAYYDDKQIHRIEVWFDRSEPDDGDDVPAEGPEPVVEVHPPTQER